MFNTKGQEIKTSGGSQKSLQPGVVYAHIYDAQVRTAKSGKKALELTLEGPAMENFEGWAVDRNNIEGEKFKGQSAKVMATIYTADFNLPSPSANDIIYKILFIASELGLRDDVDAINASTIEGWVTEAVKILKNKNLYFFLKGTEEEYNGKTIIKLSLPKYKFVSSEKDSLDTFDKNNQYHYKALQNKPISGFEPATDDFEM